MMIRFMLAAALMAFWTSVASADSLLQVEPGLGDVIVTAVFSTVDDSLVGADIRGTTLALISDPGPEGFVVFTDGGNPGSFGNSLMLSTDLPGFTEAVAIGFDFTRSQFVGPELVVPGLGIPLGTVTSPLLLPLLGTLEYGFDPTSVSPGPFSNTETATFKLDSTVPEPDGIVFMSLGVILIAVIDRLRTLYPRRL